MKDRIQVIDAIPRLQGSDKLNVRLSDPPCLLDGPVELKRNFYYMPVVLRHRNAGHQPS